MLELPEVEILRKDLEKEVVGKRVKDVIISTASIVRPFHRTRPQFVELLTDRKIEGARRRGAVVFLDLDEGLTWIIDPGDTSSLHRETATTDPGPDTHMVVTFTIGGAIHITDTSEEVSASTGVVPTEEALEAAGIGPDALDPLDDNPTWPEFGRRLRAAAMPLKRFVTDPQQMVGLGRVYSDEILWEAGLAYDRMSDTLSTQEVRRFYRSMQEVIAAAMKQRDSHLEQVERETIFDDEGEVAEYLKVYGREGQPCFRCRRTIKRADLGDGVEAYHCEQCQI